jgi:hypothetical protein
MNTRFHRSQAGNRDTANGQSSGKEMPLDDGHVAVLASRASVVAVAEAMGYQPATDGTGTNSDKAERTREETSPGDNKKDSDKKYRRTEREADGKAGIKPCPVKFPADLHQSLRQRVNEIHAPEGSRALLAFTSFTLRPELNDILHAIELRDDREDLVKALQSIVQTDWLVKTAIRLSTVAPQPSSVLHAQIPRLIDTMVRCPDLISAILAITTSPTLQAICIELADKAQMQRELLHLATCPGETEFLVRMSRLSPADRDFLLTLLNLDSESKHALAAAAPYPEITRLVVKAGRDASIHAAIQTVARSPGVAKTGLAVINGKGLVGWIARKAVRILLHRQQNDRR